MVAVVIVVGMFVAGLSAAGLMSGSLNRVAATVDTLHRTEPLETYSGRPMAATQNQKNAPENYAVLVAEGDRLDGAFVVHVSASQVDLTVLAVPSDLRYTNEYGLSTTLSAEYADGPSAVARALETVTQARMDHQIVLDESDCWPVVSAAGGLKLSGKDSSSSEAQLRAWADAATDPTQHVVRLSQVVIAAMSRFSILSSVTEAGQFDQAIEALPACLSVDPSLTSDEVSDALVNTRVRPDEIGSLVVPSIHAGPVTLAQIRAALANDTIASLAKQHPATDATP